MRCSHLRPVPSFPLIAARVVLTHFLCFRPGGRVTFPLGVGARHSPLLDPFAAVGGALQDTIGVFKYILIQFKSINVTEVPHCGGAWPRVEEQKWCYIICTRI